MTGNVKLDMGLTIFFVLLFAASEALGKSKRFKPNGVVQLLASVIRTGTKDILDRTPMGVTGKIICKVGECVETAIEEKLNEGLAPPKGSPVPPTPTPAKQVPQGKPQQAPKSPPAQTTTGVGDAPALKTTPGRHDVG